MGRQRTPRVDSGPYGPQHLAAAQAQLVKVRKTRDACSRADRIGVNCQDVRQQLDDLEAGFRTFIGEYFPHAVGT